MLAGNDAEVVLAVRLSRGRVLKALGELQRATAELVLVEQRALVAERPDLRCEALIALANIDGKQGRPTDARRRLEEAATIVRASYTWDSSNALINLLSPPNQSVAALRLQGGHDSVEDSGQVGAGARTRIEHVDLRVGEAERETELLA